MRIGDCYPRDKPSPHTHTHTHPCAQGTIIPPSPWQAELRSPAWTQINNLYNFIGMREIQRYTGKNALGLHNIRIYNIKHIIY